MTPTQDDVAAAGAVSTALRRFGLGDPVRPPEPLHEAWSNRVFHVETRSGAYAIKIFAPVDDDRDRTVALEAAMEIEAAALATGQVAMPEPVRDAETGRWLTLLNGGDTNRRLMARCHRWVVGRPGSSVPPSVAVAADVARSVAVLHGLRLPGGDTSQLPGLDVARWSRAVETSRNARAAWVEELAGLGPTLEEIDRRRSALRGTLRAMWGGHRDLDPKNAVIGADGSVVLTDWDFAGPVLPWVEVVDAAVSFAGGWLAADTAVVDAFLHTYLAAGRRPEPVAPEMVAASSVDLDWLLRNVERSLSSACDEERTLGERIASELIQSFPASVAAMEAWARHAGDRLRATW